MIAITSGVKDMQAVLNLVWDKLLPAMKPSPLPDDDQALEKLVHTLAGLSLKPQEGAAPRRCSRRSPARNTSSPQTRANLSRSSLKATIKAERQRLLCSFDGKDRRIVCGKGEWRKGVAAFGSLDEQPAAVCGAWSADDTYSAKICLVETPFLMNVSLKFDGDTVSLDSKSNVGFGATKPPTLVGKVE